MLVLDDFYARESARAPQEEAAVKEKQGRIGASIKAQLKKKEEFGKRVAESREKAELIYGNFPLLEEAVQAVKAAVRKKYTQKEIMYKLKKAASEGSKSASLIKDVDLKDKRIVVEL
jgi:predicted ribosome quality control (RQC) complex YloA/Tae2 family protein